jgi:hypothetical protein
VDLQCEKYKLILTREEQEKNISQQRKKSTEKEDARKNKEKTQMKEREKRAQDRLRNERGGSQGRGRKDRSNSGIKTLSRRRKNGHSSQIRRGLQVLLVAVLMIS